MKKRILKVKRGDFLNWYFDGDTDADFVDDIIDGLRENTRVIVTMKRFESVGYIPNNLIKNKEVLTKEEIKEGEVENPSSDNEIEWV